MGWMMWLLLMLFWLLILVALAGSVYWLFSRFVRNTSSGSTRDVASETSSKTLTGEALQMLNTRYTHGEIDDEEYTKRKRKRYEEGGMMNGVHSVALVSKTAEVLLLGLLSVLYYAEPESTIQDE